MPALSIVIPVYNIENYVDRCLSSLENQSFKDFEVICVDDGSTDKSSEKLSAWAAKDKRIGIITQPNRGPSCARNVGIEAAQGEYVCFLDGDDRLYPMACKEIVDMLESSGADILVFGATYVPEKAGNGWYYWALSPRNITYDAFSMDILLREPSRPFVWKMAFKREFLVDSGVRFDEAVRFGEDQIFCFAVYPRASKVRFSSRKLYEYRLERDGSAMDIMKDDVHARMLKHVGIADNIFADWENLGILHEHASEMISWAMDFVLPEMVKVHQDEFADVCDHFSALLRKYVSEAEIQAIEIPEDKRFALDLYKRSSQNLLRRKRSAQEFYQVRNKAKPIWRWVASSWYLPREE